MDELKFAIELFLNVFDHMVLTHITGGLCVVAGHIKPDRYGLAAEIRIPLLVSRTRICGNRSCKASYCHESCQYAGGDFLSSYHNNFLLFIFGSFLFEPPVWLVSPL